MNDFKYIPLREKKKEEKRKRYIKIYNDVMNKVAWSVIATRYSYKNEHTAKSCYYSYVVPFLKKYGSN